MSSNSQQNFTKFRGKPEKPPNDIVLYNQATEGDIKSIYYYVYYRNIPYLIDILKTLKSKRNSSSNSSSKEKYDKAIKYIENELRDLQYLKSNGAFGNPPWPPVLPQGGKRQTKKRKHTKRRQTKKRQTRRR